MDTLLLRKNILITRANPLVIQNHLYTDPDIDLGYFSVRWFPATLMSHHFNQTWIAQTEAQYAWNQLSFSLPRLGYDYVHDSLILHIKAIIIRYLYFSYLQDLVHFYLTSDCVFLILID